MSVPRRWPAAAAVTLAAIALSACGGDDEPSPQAPTEGTFTGCLTDAGFAVRRRSADLVEVTAGEAPPRTEREAADGEAQVFELGSEDAAGSLHESIAGDSADLLGNRVAIYRTDPAPGLRDAVATCARENPSIGPSA